jgi:uncharacterized phage-associated protein
MENTLSIANYFLIKAWESGDHVTPMKILKMVYIAHGWHLGLFDEPLLPEPVQAWKYGPVVESVYHTFKGFGKAQVTELAFDHSDNDYYKINDKKHIPLLDKIWEVYGSYSGVELSAMTHQEGTPWFYVWEKCNGKYNAGAIIPNDVIERHYKQKIANAGQK